MGERGDEGEGDGRDEDHKGRGRIRRVEERR